MLRFALLLSVTSQSLLWNHLLPNNFMFFNSLQCKLHLLFQILYSGVMIGQWFKNLCYGAQWINIIENSSLLATLCGTSVEKPCNCLTCILSCTLLKHGVDCVFGAKCLFSWKGLWLQQSQRHPLHCSFFFPSFQLWQAPLLLILLWNQTQPPITPFSHILEQLCRVQHSELFEQSDA